MLWFYNGASIVERFMWEAHSYFGPKAGVMFEPSAAWEHDSVTAKKLMCTAMKYDMNEVSYWTNLAHMNATAWGPAMRAYITANMSFCFPNASGGGGAVEVSVGDHHAQEEDEE